MKTRADYVARGYADMAKRQTWQLADCPYKIGTWQREAWQTGAWRWMRPVEVVLGSVRVPRWATTAQQLGL